MKNKIIGYIAIFLLLFSVDAVNFFGSGASDRKRRVAAWFCQHKMITASGGGLVVAALAAYGIDKRCKWIQITTLWGVNEVTLFEFVAHRLAFLNKGQEDAEEKGHQGFVDKTVKVSQENPIFNKFLTNRLLLTERLSKQVVGMKDVWSCIKLRFNFF